MQLIAQPATARVTGRVLNVGSRLHSRRDDGNGVSEGAVDQPDHLESETAARFSHFAAASRGHFAAAVAAAVVVTEQLVQQSTTLVVTTTGRCFATANRCFAAASRSDFDAACGLVSRCNFAAASGLTGRSCIAAVVVPVEQAVEEALLPGGSTARIGDFAAACGSHFVAARRSNFAATSGLTSRGGVT